MKHPLTLEVLLTLKDVDIYRLEIFHPISGFFPIILQSDSISR